MEDEEELTIFQLESLELLQEDSKDSQGGSKEPFTLHSSLKPKRRTTRAPNKATKTSIVQKHLLDSGLEHVWTGNQDDAIRLLKPRTDPVSLARTAVANIYLMMFSSSRVLTESQIAAFLLAEKSCIVRLEEMMPKMPLFFRLLQTFKRIDTKPVQSLDDTKISEYAEVHGYMCLSRFIRGTTDWFQAITCFPKLVKMANSVDWSNTSMHKLVLGALHLFVSTRSQRLKSILARFGLEVDLNFATTSLETVAEEDSEAGHYAKLVLANYFLAQTDLAFRPDRAVFLKKADVLVSSTLKLHPKWIAFQYLQSLVCRHLGKLDQASDLVDKVMETLRKNSNTALLESDSVALAFVREKYTLVEKKLGISTPLSNGTWFDEKIDLSSTDPIGTLNEDSMDKYGWIAPGMMKNALPGTSSTPRRSSVTRRASTIRRASVSKAGATSNIAAFSTTSSAAAISAGSAGPQDPHSLLLLSACIAKRGDIVPSVQMLENAIHFAPHAWHKKLTMLQYRPHKHTLYYERCYFLGYLKWFEVEIAGGLRAGDAKYSGNWLKEAERQLELMHHVAENSVHFRDPNGFWTQENMREELLAVMHLRGVVRF